ncbi:PP2C family protein-serine/threonine phosphatase [Streptomyces sp. NPDC001380]|uniref:PP2C family protein-serine/threonine phosphatase n=1 Tax=Streptomyces sp. NPDC001380 TaxID=3364566 RepID=UPI0036C52F88
MNTLLSIERALRAAAPHRLLDVLRDALADHCAALATDLLMADYGLTVLQPVTLLPHTGKAVPVHSSAAGRAFGSQQPHAEQHGDGTCTLHVPVSVRGDRIGVLSVVLPEAPGPRTVEEVAEIAEIAAHHVAVAERDTDLYLQARRRSRLTLAAEMQWQLLPGRSCARPEYTVGAQLEPAYHVRGDNFDWSADADHLTVAVTNGMGDGIAASLLTSLAVNALRNARRAGIPLADQVALADQAVWAQYRGERYVSVLLMRFELATGRVEVVDAGSPRAFLVRDGEAAPLSFDAQLPLGMLEETLYAVQETRVEPGDRLVVVSDGVHTAASAQGEQYGERALARAVLATRLLPPADVPRAVLRELAGHRGTLPVEDDAVVLCLDWRGRQA